MKWSTASSPVFKRTGVTPSGAFSPTAPYVALAKRGDFLVSDELRLTNIVVALAAEKPVHVVTQPQFCSVGYPKDIATAQLCVREWQL